jgi:large subunit ribosomal protein L28
MSMVCDLVRGKKPSSGNKVSHSRRRTKRRFVPNIQLNHLHSDILGVSLKLKIATSTMRTVLKHGGLDAYLLSTRASHLSDFGLKLKRRLRRLVSVRDKVHVDAAA